MPALRPHRWTIEEVNRLANEQTEPTQRFELVDGELLVTPSPTDRHQRIVVELFVLLREYVKRHKLGEVRLGPARARITPTSRLEPDLFVVAAVDGRMPRAEEPLTPLLLIVEVLSSESARGDRITKRNYFQSHAVPEFWAVDGDGEADVPAFELDVRRFFAGIAD